MKKLSTIVPVTDLRQDATAILKRVGASKEPVIITQRGRAAAVLLNLETYERARYEMELLKVLAKGEKEIGKGKHYDLSEVLAAADEILGEENE